MTAAIRSFVSWYTRAPMWQSIWATPLLFAIYLVSLFINLKGNKS